jgi:ADP-heptose:LPS heptosyltransferase
MDYTERDFVALAALGLYRVETSIELQVMADGVAYAQELKQQLPVGKPVIGLNIGCGTSDAYPRRPPIEQIANALHSIASDGPFVCLLTGAPFEKSINEAFIHTFGIQKGGIEFIDCAGQTSLSELTGLISLCDVFISSDSGPYHMAVALKKPTIAWFMYDEPAAYHRYDWCKCLVQPSAEQVAQAMLALLKKFSNEDICH